MWPLNTSLYTLTLKYAIVSQPHPGGPKNNNIFFFKYFLGIYDSRLEISPIIVESGAL